MLTRRFLTVLFLLAVLVGVATSAQACTVGMPGSLTEVVKEGGWPEANGGIYEQETIAWAPPILIRDTATASVVTRFWGRPPANVGVQYEGGEWFSFLNSLFGIDSCDGILDEDGNLVAPNGQVGTVGYGMAPPPENTEGPLSPEEAAAQGTIPFHRSAPLLELENGSRTGKLSPSEIAALEGAYGSATVLEIPFWTRAQATFVVWWPSLLAVALVVGGVIYTVRKRKGRSRSESAAKVNAGAEPH